MHGSSAIPSDLPEEIWLMIAGLLDAPERKQMRQTCKRFNRLATPLLFESLYFELCGRGCESLYNISRSLTLAPCVKTLVLRRIRGYREFPSSWAWAKSVFQPGDPGDHLSLPSETSYYDDVQASKQLLPYSEWIALSEEHKEALYHEYEADRNRAQEELRGITDTLRFRSPAATSSALIHPNRAPNSTAASTAAVHRFYDALEELQNLQTLHHEPAFLHDDDWACRWRDLYFHPMSLIGYTHYFDDEDAEALQLSIVLQALAWVRRGDSMLRKLSAYVGGPAFATPARLRHLWAGDGHEMTRYYRQLNSDAAEGDRMAYSSHSNMEQSQLYHGQLQLMRTALDALTHLDYMVSDEGELAGCLDIAAGLVFYFLKATHELRKLRLVFGRLVDGILLQPLSGYNERTCSQGSIRLLKTLTLQSPWTVLGDIELEMAIDKDTLLQFLLAHKDTLRSLTLTRVTLVRLGDPLNTWELALTEIGQGLSLTSLALRNIFDFPQELRTGVVEEQGRMLFNSEDIMWKGKIAEYCAYYEATIGCVLRQETILSLNPKVS
jgi:hypothetical protein